MPESHGKFTPQHAWTLAERKFFLLFLFLLGSLLLYPYAESRGYYAFRVLSTATVAFCVYAVSFRRSLLAIAVVLAIPALLQRVLNLSVHARSFSILSMVLSLAFDVLIVAVILRRILAPHQPDSETIFGALCIYLLVGFAFANVYGLVARIRPHAFYLDPVANVHADPDRLDLIYYSFAIMTSLGAPGITPVSGEARCVSVVEAILGVLYLAVLISRLVAAYRHPAA